MRFRDRAVLIALATAGIVSLLRLLDWWFRPTHVGHPLLFVMLSLAFWYGAARLVVGWLNYLAITAPEHRRAPPGLRVAIFTTSSPGEPLEMIAKTLAACARVRYPHTTYLLDDSGDPAFAEAAVRHDATPVVLIGIPGAKAGKINRALQLTTEDFILVLDPDHVPFPNFLDRVLGHFDDPRVGFVQVAQAYYNQRRSFTAAAAAEQTYAFYGPGLMGLYGHGGSLAIGANCTFRRVALTEIGGHGIGLAEDLITAIRLHGAGWQSVYVPEIVSRGLVPEDLGSFYRQQLKWSRGVHEMLFSELVPLWTRLTWRQRFSYLTIGTYYISGATTALYLVFPYLYLWSGLQAAQMPFDEFVAATAPVGVVGATLYGFVQRWLCDPIREAGLHWRGLALKLAAWPVFLAGGVLAIARIDVPYIPTAKQAVGNRFLRLGWPQCLLLLIYAVTAGRVVSGRLLSGDEQIPASNAEAAWGMLMFATIPAMAALSALYAAWQSRRPLRDSPWQSVKVDSLGEES